jgi:hypothetical protein
MLRNFTAQASINYSIGMETYSVHGQNIFRQAAIEFMLVGS